jgi:hypothetical protein
MTNFAQRAQQNLPLKFHPARPVVNVEDVAYIQQVAHLGSYTLSG